jgi:hypothetical protein
MLPLIFAAFLELFSFLLPWITPSCFECHGIRHMQPTNQPGSRPQLPTKLALKLSLKF